MDFYLFLNFVVMFTTAIGTVPKEQYEVKPIPTPISHFSAVHQAYPSNLQPPPPSADISNNQPSSDSQVQNPTGVGGIQPPMHFVHSDPTYPSPHSPNDKTHPAHVPYSPSLPTPQTQQPTHNVPLHQSQSLNHMYHTPSESMECKDPEYGQSPYYEDSLDCNCYYVCSKQRNAIKMCCPSGLWWDQSSLKCLFGREFGLRKQALCLQLTRRKVLAQARSTFQKQILSSDSSKEENIEDEKDASSANKVDLTLDRYYANVPEEYIYGHCSVQPNPVIEDLRDFVWGSIDLRQSLKGGPTELRINLTGLAISDNNRLHGFHVHEYGDLSKGCQSAGGHYDPFGVVHGGPRDSPQFRHFGDLGNLEEDSEGMVETETKDYLVSLLGPFSVLGRAIVIHEKEDDLGRGNTPDSLLTGSAGARLACCTIGLSDGSRWS